MSRFAAVIAIVGSASVAHAGVEIGGTAGVHTFSDTEKLGMVDTPAATTLNNSAMFGLRIGVLVGDRIGIEGEAGVIPTESKMPLFDGYAPAGRGTLVHQLRNRGALSTL